MADSHHSLERQLTVELRRVEAPYRRALALLRGQALPADAALSDLTSALKTLQPVMEQVREIERELAPLRQAWIASGARAAGDFKQLLQQHEALLRELIGRIDQLETQVQQRRGELAPGVDQAQQHRRMQRAYQQGPA